MKKLMVLVAAVMLFGGAERAEAQGFVVIVNSANPVSELSKDDVSKMFLKRSKSWAAGGAVAVVDQPRSVGVREAFSQAVHGRGANAVDSYWQQQVFAGKDVPPPEKATDAEVVEFVKANPGAIGYVAPASGSAAGVKTVAVK